MFSDQAKYEYLSRRYLWLWIGLAFQAGAANAGGFLACARFVSHMTGFGTQVGISLSQFDYWMALEMFSAPLSFLIGAMASALFVDRRLMRGEKPLYLVVMSFLVAIFSIVAVGGHFGLFGVFGEPLRLERDFALMSILCFACGMQNACFGSLTRGQIRTTHLTGILTDMGVTFVKLLLLERHPRERTILGRTNFIRILTFFSFSTGSALSAVAFARLGFAAFGFLVALAGLLLLRTMRQDLATQRARAQRSQTTTLSADSADVDGDRALPTGREQGPAIADPANPNRRHSNSSAD